MPLDPSIILGAGQGITPLQNPMDVAGKALNYQNLAMQNTSDRQKFNDEQAMRNAYAQNTKVDENGNPSIDRKGILKSLAETSPSMVPHATASFQKMDNDLLKSNLEKVGSAAQMLNGVTDQGTYNAVKNSPLAQAAGAGNWPAQYDKGFVDNLFAQSLTHKEMLEHQAKEQGLEIDKDKAKVELKKLDMDIFKTFGAPLSKTPGQGKGSNKASDIDPAALVSRVVPPDRQKDVFEEIKRAQLVAKNAPDILNAFDRGAKENTTLRTGGGYLRTPGSVMALHQLLLPNFKTIDGTVRQAAMDETFHNVTPEPGDTAAKISEKREALKNWLTSETAGTTANGFGIDISKYKRTSIDPKILSGSSGKSEKVADRPHDKPVGASMVGSDGQTYTKTAQGWVPSNVATK